MGSLVAMPRKPNYLCSRLLVQDPVRFIQGLRNIGVFIIRIGFCGDIIL